MKTKKNVKIKDHAIRKKSLQLHIVQSSFRDKADLTKWVHETAGKTPYRPDARLITSRPFQDGGGYLCDAEYAKQNQLGVQVELTDKEKILIGQFVGVTFSYSQRFINRLECVITQKCSLQDTKRFTWDKIIACIENYNSMNPQGNTADMNKPQGKDGQPTNASGSETNQDITPSKRPGVWNRLKGFGRELYGVTIERITKAWLDKYG